MSKDDIRRYTARQLRELGRKGESRTDVSRIEAMSDPEVEASVAGDPDWSSVPHDWHERAEAVMPRTKIAVSIRLDADLVEQFRSTGRGWQTRVNAVLRAYAESRKAPAG